MINQRIDSLRSIKIQKREQFLFNNKLQQRFFFKFYLNFLKIKKKTKKNQNQRKVNSLLFFFLLP